MAVFALLHSPLTSAFVWGYVAEELRFRGHHVVVPSVDFDQQPPYSMRYVAQASACLRNELGTKPATLVAHSGAGPLVAQISFARLAQGSVTPGYIFVDAGLPTTAGVRSRLDQLAIEDADFARDLQTHLDKGGSFPEWTDADLLDEVPNPRDRAQLIASLRPRPRQFFTEELPLPQDWPDAPVAYVRTSSAYDTVEAIARLRSWAVVHAEGGHFCALADPSYTATLIESAAALIS